MVSNRQYLNTSFYASDDHAVPQANPHGDLLNTFLEDDYFQDLGENNAMMIRRTSCELMDTFPTSASMLNLMDAGNKHHHQQGGDVLNFDSLYPETSELSEGGFSDAVVPQFFSDTSDITSMAFNSTANNKASVKKQEQVPFSFFGNASRAMNMSMMAHPSTEAAAVGFVPTPMEPIAVVPQMISNHNSNPPQPSRRRAARPVADPLMMMNTAVNIINNNNKRPAEDAEDDMLHGDDDDDDYIPTSHRTMSTRRHPEGRMTSGSVGGASGASGGLVGEERELTRKERVARWLEKRKHRNFSKRVRYVSRKAYADVRPRIKGRFVSPEIYAAYMRGEPVMVDGTEVVLPACAVVAATA